MDRNWHDMILLWTNDIYKNRIIRGNIGNYKPPPGFTAKDYVLHGQLASIYNDVKQLKTVVDRDGGQLTANTDNDIYTRIFLGVTSVIILIFSFLFKIRMRLQKLKSANGALQSTTIPTVQLGTMNGVSVPKYASGVCAYWHFIVIIGELFISDNPDYNLMT